MSTTLTNGLKLPDKGSVDWYADMQSNYAILDGAVGTVADHTTALAGKAPAVHTHTKSDITDFPVYGNTAGTICEGNDSRLSDARTPVAHTHTKSDVTDLLNSDFIPSANNSYNLGSSSYQWNNLYAKRVNTQSINGINPGVLSLPARDYLATMAVDTTDWDLTGTTFYYTPAIDGWLQINVSPNNNYAYIAIEYATLRNNCENTTGRNARLTVPVVANKRYDITIIGSAIAHAILALCQGNV